MKLSFLTAKIGLIMILIPTAVTMGFFGFFLFDGQPLRASGTCIMTCLVLLEIMLLFLFIKRNLWGMRFSSEGIEVWYGRKILQTYRLDEVVQIHEVSAGSSYPLVMFSLTHSEQSTRRKAAWLGDLLPTVHYKNMLVVSMTHKEVAYVKELFSSVCPVEEEHRFW